MNFFFKLPQIEPTRVIQVKTTKTDGYNSVQIGTGLRKLKNYTAQQLGHIKKWGDGEPVPLLKEFRVSEV